MIDPIAHPKSPAELGRSVVSAYMHFTGVQNLPIFYVNYQDNYISIKIEGQHLTTDQLEWFNSVFKRNAKFIETRNSHVTASRWEGKRPKVVVRFHR